MPRKTVRYPIPANPADFEWLCRPLLARALGLAHLQRYAPRGARQYGVDLLGTDSKRHLYGIQCKLHETGKQLKQKEVKDEIGKVRKFPRKLRHYVIATTAKRNRDVQTWASGRRFKQTRGHLVQLAVYAWEDIEELLGDYPDVADAYLGTAQYDVGKILLPKTVAVRSERNPGTLLDPRYEVIRFHEEARSKEVDEVKRWCEDDSLTSVRLFTGPGGSGKTRLFIEWARRLRDKGWWAGFLPEKPMSRETEALVSPVRPTLIVVDYAESLPRLGDFLTRVATRSTPVGPLRVALLARDAGDWWNALKSDADVRGVLAQDGPTRLEPVPIKGGLRQRVFDKARDAFKRTLRKAAPNANADLSDDVFGRILYLHMAALAAVEGLPVNAASLLDEIVNHEKTFWRHASEGTDWDQQDLIEAVARTVAAVTLRGGVPTKQDAEALNKAASGPAGGSFITFLRRLYPGSAQRGAHNACLNALEPDLLGEHLVRSVLSDPGTPAGFLDRIFQAANDTALRNGFLVLGRVGLHPGGDATEWVGKLLAADVNARARPAFDAALALGEQSALAPLGMVLAQALEREGTAELAREFESRIPEQTVSLREVAIWATQRLLKEVHRRSTKVVARSERARLLNNLGGRLSELGRREQALEATQEAVDHYRALAQKRPGAFLPDLAMGLSNLGIRLRGLDRRKQALEASQEAVNHYRALAQNRPDAFLPDLAMSLNNLGLTLGGLGRREDAVKAAREAVGISVGLVERLPEAFVGDLRIRLANLIRLIVEAGGSPGKDADVQRARKTLRRRRGRARGQ